MSNDRIFIKGTPVDNYSVDEVIDKVKLGEKIFHIFVNVHKMVTFSSDGSLRPVASDTRCIFSVDGKWPQILAYLKDGVWRHKFGGLDMIKAIFTLADSSEQDLTVYLYGGDKEVINKTCAILKEKYKNAVISGIMDGFSGTDEETMEKIKKSKPAIVFLAIPSPARELLGYRILNEVDSVKYIAGVGGAFDVLSNKYKRAPKVYQDLGLEWCYRCFQHPVLFKRYLYDFFYMIRLVFHADPK